MVCKVSINSIEDFALTWVRNQGIIKYNCKSIKKAFIVKNFYSKSFYLLIFYIVKYSSKVLIILLLYFCWMQHDWLYNISHRFMRTKNFPL